MPSFWDTLKNVGIDTATKVTQPIFSGIGQAFSNVVTGTQNKVAGVVTQVINTTDPAKKAAAPAQPPTSAPVPSAAVLQTLGAAATPSNFGILVVAALLVLLIYLIRKRT